jgi:hypothetical protein
LNFGSDIAGGCESHDDVNFSDSLSGIVLNDLAIQSDDTREDSPSIINVILPIVTMVTDSDE